MTDDIKALWKGQAEEGSDMGLARVHALLRRYRIRTSRSRLALAILGVGSTGLSAYLAITAPLSVPRVGQVLLAAGLAVLFWQSWRRLAQPPPGDDIEACTVFLRLRLVARRDAAGGSWLWRVAPAVPGMAVILTGLAFGTHERWPSLAPKFAPILAGLVIWLALMLLIMHCERTKVDAEIADLDKLMGR